METSLAFSLPNCTPPLLYIGLPDNESLGLKQNGLDLGFIFSKVTRARGIYGPPAQLEKSKSTNF